MRSPGVDSWGGEGGLGAGGGQGVADEWQREWREVDGWHIWRGRVVEGEFTSGMSEEDGGMSEEDGGPRGRG